MIVSVTKAKKKEIDFSPHFYRFGEAERLFVDHQLARVITLIFEVTPGRHA